MVAAIIFFSHNISLISDDQSKTCFLFKNWKVRVSVKKQKTQSLLAPPPRGNHCYHCLYLIPAIFPYMVFCTDFPSICTHEFVVFFLIALCYSHFLTPFTALSKDACLWLCLILSELSFGRLGYFHVYAVINNTVMNIFEHSIIWMFLVTFIRQLLLSIVFLLHPAPSTQPSTY